MKGNKVRHIKRSLLACLLTLSMLSAIGCGGGGGGGASTPAPTPAPVVSTSNWNEFNWDDGTTWQ